MVIARERGFPLSTHVSWLGLRSKKDWVIVQHAVRDGYVLVTNNATDFTSLVRRQDVHAGLVCLNVATGLMSLDAQRRLFKRALDELEGEEPINEVLEISLASNLTVRALRYVMSAMD